MTLAKDVTSPNPNAQLKRKEARLPTRRRAKILFGKGRSMECVICDISGGGALLQLRWSSSLPRNFQLDDGRGPPREAAVAWEGTNHIGVRFVGRSVKSEGGFGRRKS